jgi:dethiobiotin synthetase/adenosylmethionine--8-amino-7-oxononanoate aminotransferase
MLRQFSTLSRDKRYIIYGANTDVGKTFIGSLLAHFSDKREPTFYLKPVQTGFPADSDARFVKQFSPNVLVDTIYTYSKPISPHLAAIDEQRFISDVELIDAVKKTLEKQEFKEKPTGFIETAGGVNSPVMSGTLHCDLYRAFRYPVILAGDSKLGGISTTLSSYETLKLRGYDVDLLLLFDGPNKNHEMIQRYVDCKVSALPFPPEKLPNASIDREQIQNYLKRVPGHDIIEYLHQKHRIRIDSLQNLREEGEKHVWWPFTQHQIIKEPMVIDSAYEDQFTVLNPKKKDVESTEYVDACASWWTQGLGHGNPLLAKSAAYAAGRYGHVIAPEAVHEPMVKLANELVQLAGPDWFDKCFFSDNGSTAIEVAIKMALMKTDVEYSKRHLLPIGSQAYDVVGLKGSYHGDTIGAMDLSDPNVYNERVHWYQGRGFWFDVPTFGMKDGLYRLNLPTDLTFKGKITFSSQRDIFETTCADRQSLYRDYISAKLQKYVANSDRKLGALVMEPVIMGAGGMMFVDPLFQAELMYVVRHPELWDPKSPPLPVIFDEVFVGMYRLGMPSVHPLIQEKPDITCFAKCLTGGLLPLSATLATKAIFDVFQGETKLQALLHGHSYTAHPVGCTVALESLKQYKQLDFPKWTCWDEKVPFNFMQVVITLSKHPKVEQVNVLGTVLVVELRSEEKGYLAQTSKHFIASLREKGVYARPLGNVVYFMAGQKTPSKTLNSVLDAIQSSLDQLQ